MIESAFFSYERFMSLAGSDLGNYVEPFLTTQSDAIPESVYELLEPRLAALDIEHTVYALEICMLLKPRDFISRVVGFLSHDDSSVCCTAYRLIKSTQPGLMPADLVAEVAETPTVDLFASDVRSGKRIRIGTNEEFIHDLVERFHTTTSRRAGAEVIRGVSTLPMPPHTQTAADERGRREPDDQAGIIGSIPP